MILLFSSVGLWRQQLRPEARVHGIIQEGGTAANIIPDRTRAWFMLRSPEQAEYERMKVRFRAMAEAAAAATGTTVELVFSGGATSMKPNLGLEARWIANAAAYGIVDQGPDPTSGSTDMANVSWVCPTIHPDLAIADEGTPGPLDPLPRRGRHAACRRDDAPRRDARRPDRLRAVRRSGPRRGSLAGVPRQGLTGLRPAALADARMPAARPAGRWMRTGGAPSETIRAHGAVRSFVSGGPVAERPHDPESSADVDFAAANGWDREYEAYSDFDLPTYVGPTTFMNLPWITDPAELRARGVDVAIVGAPFDDAVSHRSGARFGPRAIREAQYTSGSIHSLQLGVEPFEILTVVDAGDANIVPAWIERAHALIYRKVREVAETGAIPIVLGGDHSITWPSATAVAEVRRPGSIGIVHFDAHADTANDDWGVLAGHGTPMRRLIESGAVEGQELRPGRPARLLAAGRDLRVDEGARPSLPLHDRDRGARRRGRHRRRHRRGARRAGLDLPQPRHRRRRPGLAPGHRHARSPAGCCRASCSGRSGGSSRRSSSPGMDIVEVSPPYDHAETTAMIANRAALEAISALAVKRRDGAAIRWTP